MRISDWSSDVCSSDLRAAHDALVAEAPPRRERTAGGRPSRACEPSGDARSRPHPCDGAGERHSARPRRPLPHGQAMTSPLYLAIDTPHLDAALTLAQKVRRHVGEIGSAHGRTPVNNAHLVCRLLLEKKK